MKSFEKAMRYKWQAQSSHTFFLYLNVADDVLNESSKENVQIEQMSDHLLSSTVVGDAVFTAFFDRGRGIRFASKRIEGEFLKFLAELHPEKDDAGNNIAVKMFKMHRIDPSFRLVYALQLFDEMLSIPRAQYREKMEDEAVERSQDLDKPFFAAVIEYVNTIVPTASAGDRAEDRDSLVTLLAWAKSRTIASARNMVVLVGDSLQSVAPELRSETNGISLLKILFPDTPDREHVIEFYAKQYPFLDGSIDAKSFARLSAGLSRSVLGSVIKEARIKKKPITGDLVFEKKKKFIDEQSGGLVEVMQPLWGIDAIGGLEEHKKYNAEVVAAIKNGNLLAVPMGILLLGCPGVGKTVFAEAIAYEAGLPFVKLKNIREMWVGQSERNLDFALELIAAMAPVVVFVDEIDQEYQSRSGGPGDNTGVNNRLQRRLFEFMSDTTLRGKVVWLAASNRPDLLDPAMLREGRYDERIPFFPPNAEERAKIFIAILRKMKVHAESLNTVFKRDPELERFAQEFAHLARRVLQDGRIVPCDPEFYPPGKAEDDKVLPFTGAQIEAVLRKAYVIAQIDGAGLSRAHVEGALNDFIPSQNFAQYLAMTEAAIMHCNSERFIPQSWKKRAANLRRMPSSDGGINLS